MVNSKQFPNQNARTSRSVPRGDNGVCVPEVRRLTTVAGPDVRGEALGEGEEEGDGAEGGAEVGRVR